MTIAVILDLDDTLYLERDYIHSGFHAVGEFVRSAHGVGDFGNRCWEKFLQGLRGEIFNQSLADCGLPNSKDVVQQLVEEYRHHVPDIHLASDAESWLATDGADYCLGIITDGPQVSQLSKVVALGLNRRISEIVFTDRWGRNFWKPHHRAFEHVSQVLGVNPENCVYVGDNPHKDFIAPRALGWKSVRIRRPLGLHAAEVDSSFQAADWEISTFDELTIRLHELFGSSLRRGRAA